MQVSFRGNNWTLLSCIIIPLRKLPEQLPEQILGQSLRPGESVTARNRLMNTFRIANRSTSASTTATLRCFHASGPMSNMANGDLNNTAAERIRKHLKVDPTYRNCSFAIPQFEDDAEIRKKYRPFLLDEETTKSDWVSQLELSTALELVQSQVLNNGQERLKILVLHGSMRDR